jgi:hypothetical protein
MMPEEVVVADAPASPSYFYDHWGVARELEPPTVHNPWETPLKPTVKTVPLYSASWDRTRGQQEVHVHTPPDASKPEVLKHDHPKEPQTDHPNDARLSERVAQTLEDAERTLAEAKNMLAQDVQTLVQQYRLSLDDGEQTLEGVQHLLAKEEKDGNGFVSNKINRTYVGLDASVATTANSTWYQLPHVEKFAPLIVIMMLSAFVSVAIHKYFAARHAAAKRRDGGVPKVRGKLRATFVRNIRGTFGVIHGTFGDIQGTSRERPGTIQRTLRELSEASREHPGNIQGTSRER